MTGGRDCRNLGLLAGLLTPFGASIGELHAPQFSGRTYYAIVCRAELRGMPGPGSFLNVLALLTHGRRD